MGPQRDHLDRLNEFDPLQWHIFGFHFNMIGFHSKIEHMIENVIDANMTSLLMLLWSRAQSDRQTHSYWADI